MNLSNVSRYMAIQNTSIIDIPKNMSEDALLEDETKVQNFDRVQLTQEAINQNNTIDTDEIKTKVPRTWTITLETLKSRINHIDKIVAEANSMNMSYGERMSFLEKKGQEWVDNIRKNDPEMFVEWLKINKNYIQSGEAEIASLPSDFTMKDYNFYVSTSLKNDCKTSNLDIYI